MSRLETIQITEEIPSPICLRALGKISILGLYESGVEWLTDASRARSLGNYLKVADAETGGIC